MDSIGPRELETLQREAWEAFEYGQPRGKMDSLGRIWHFEPTVRNGTLHVDYHCHRVGASGLQSALHAPATNFRAIRPESDALVAHLAERIR